MADKNKQGIMTFYESLYFSKKYPSELYKDLRKIRQDELKPHVLGKTIKVSRKLGKIIIRYKS